MEKRNVCTYCGLPKKLTTDHVIPRTLWVEESNERSITVRSCLTCNGHSDEGLLRSFFVVFDERIAASRVTELAHPKGRGDLRRFLSLCTPHVQTGLPGKIFADDKITKLFRKMFMGLRRHLLGVRWSFLPPERFSLALIKSESDQVVMCPLPLSTSDQNQAFIVPPAFQPSPEVYTHHFRDFSFGVGGGEDLILRYNRSNEGNELVLFCLVQPEDQHEL